MRYHCIVWVFNMICAAAWSAPESGDIFRGCVWVEPGINTLYTFNDTFHHGLEVQRAGMVLFAQHDIPEANPKSTTWIFEPIVIDEVPLHPRRITDVKAVDIDQDGKTDLWFSGSHIPLKEQKSAWYKNTGDPHRWQRCTPFPGRRDANAEVSPPFPWTST